MAVLVGTLFALSLPCSAAAPVLTTLYNFPGYAPPPFTPCTLPVVVDCVPDGEFPEAGLVFNAAGALFGTTFSGGVDYGHGTVYELEPPVAPSTTWTPVQIYAFTGGADGANPQAGLIFSSRGVLFGTTEYGGAYGYGTVFSLTPGAGGIWTFAVVYSFAGAPAGCGTTGNPACDGENPAAGLILGSVSGYLYGTTANGGTANYGTVFELVPTKGGIWTESVLYSFAGAPDGANPVTSLTMNPNGTLYGTTYDGGVSGTAGGGAAGFGTVFELTQSKGVFTYKQLYSFNGAPSAADGGIACTTTSVPPCDGGFPWGNLVLNTTTGVLTGTTSLGGDPTGCPVGGYTQGCGTIFQLTPPVAPSTTWTETLLYTFGPKQNALLPSFNLVGTGTGTGPFYGTTFTGASTSLDCFEATTGCGMVFVLRPPVAPSTTWTFNTLAVFNSDNGGGPTGVIMGPTAGTLYGATYDGGLSGGYGTVFQVTF
jgi:uncharacterized repeat protein (TIGR03803 family)